MWLCFVTAGRVVMNDFAAVVLNVVAEMDAEDHQDHDKMQAAVDRPVVPVSLEATLQVLLTFGIGMGETAAWVSFRAISKRPLEPCDLVKACDLQNLRHPSWTLVILAKRPFSNPIYHDEALSVSVIS